MTAVFLGHARRAPRGRRAPARRPVLPGRRPRARCATASCGATSATPPRRSAASAPPSSARCPTGRSCARPAEAIKAATMARLDEHLIALEEQVTARGGTVHWARDADEANAIVTRLVQATGADEVVKVKSMATQEIGLNEALEAAGIAALRDRPRRAHRAARRRQAQSHILVPAIHQNRAEIREIFLRDDARRRPGADRRPAAAGHGRPRAPARAVPPRPGGDQRRELRRRRDRHARRGRVRGQRPDVPDPARDADHRHGHREGRADLARPRGLPAAAPPLLHRRADEPLHLAVDRRHPRRRAAGVPPGAARQRAHGGARRRGRPRGAALHPLLGLPQRLPGLRAHRRARLRLGLPRPDRRGPLPAADRRRGQRLAAVRLGLCGACYDVCPVAIDIPSILVHLRAEHVEAQTAARRPRRLAFRALSKAMSNPRLWRLAQRAAGLGRFLARGQADAARRPAAAGVEVDPHPRPAHARRRRRSRSSGPRSTADERPRRGPGRIRTALGDGPPVPAPVARDYRTADDRAAGDPSCSTCSRPARGLQGDGRPLRAGRGRRHGRGRTATRSARAPGRRRRRPRAARRLAPGRRGRGRRPPGRRRWPTSPPRSPASPSASPRPARSSSTARPRPGRRALSLLPDCLVCVVDAPTRSSAACPRASPGSTRSRR